MKTLFLSFLFFPSFLFAKPGALVDRVLAVVGDQPITLSDLRRYKNKLKTRKPVESSLLHLSSFNSLLQKQKTLLNHLINEEVLDLEIKRQNVQAPIELVERNIREVARRNGMSRAQFKDSLKARGISYTDYFNFVRKGLLRRKFFEKEIIPKIKISSSDVDKALSKEKSGSYTYTLSHLNFPKKDGHSIESVSALRSQLNPTLYKQTQQEHSQKGYSSGELGNFKLHELNAQFQKAIKGLSAGQFSEVIETPDSFQIVKLEKRKYVKEDLSKKRELVRLRLGERLFKKFVASWIQEKRKLYEIKKNI